VRGVDERVGLAAARIMRELHYLSLIEQRRFKRHFTMTLCNLSQVDLYWTPSGRRVIARALGAERKPLPLPTDARLIGTYAHPFNVNDFLGDLDDLIAKLDIDTPGSPSPALAG
jgi:hypothetical protein